jgi:hypothetical protein
MHIKIGTDILDENRELREALRPFAKWIAHVKDLGLIEAYPSGLQAKPGESECHGDHWLDVGRFWDAAQIAERDDE